MPRFGSCSRMPSPPFHSVAGVASRSLVGFFPSLPTKGLEPLRLSTCLLLLRWRLVSGQRTLEPFQTGWELSVSTEVNLNEPKARSRSKDHHGTARAHQSPPESRLFPLVSGQRVPAGMAMLPSRWHPAAAGLRSPPTEQIVRPCRRLHQADFGAPSAPVPTPTSHHMSSVLGGGVSGTCRGNVIPPHSPTPRRDAESRSGEQLCVIGPALFFSSPACRISLTALHIGDTPPWPGTREAGDENRKTVQSATSGAMFANPLRTANVGVPRLISAATIKNTTLAVLSVHRLLHAHVGL